MVDPGKPDEIEELMKMFGVEPGKGPPPPSGPAAAPALAPAPDKGKPSAASKLEFEPLTPGPPGKPEANMDLLRDVNVNVKVELGRARLYVQDILRLAPGSVVPLESLTGDPLDLYVNDRLVARGEVLVINENFAIRITEVISPQKAQEK